MKDRKRPTIGRIYTGEYRDQPEAAKKCVE